MASENLRTTFSRRLKELRKAHGLTQEKLAQKVGISLYYLQLLEGEKPSNPSLLVIEGIAAAFDMPVWKLLKFEE